MQETPEACQPRGDVAKDAPCAVGAQCASGVCYASAGKCGKCGPAPEPRPIEYSDVGEPCTISSSPQCKFELRCGAGVCEEQATEVGQSCSDRWCNPNLGLFCNDAKQCALSKISVVGDVCGGGSENPPCTNFSYCAGSTCKPRGELGEPCSVDQECAEGAACTAARTCGFVNPESCT